jgi:hypothetical protein
MSSDRKSSFAKDPENARPEKNDPHTGGGAAGLPTPHLEKADGKNRVEPISISTGSGGSVRPQKYHSPGQTADVSNPHGGDGPIPTEQLHLDKHKDHKNRTHEPKPKGDSDSSGHPFKSTKVD